MSITSAVDYSIKVYTTKSNAETDTSPLDINSAGVGEISGFEDDQYFVGFRKYYYRVEFNEPVVGFYIDWDDGEDNSKEKSNSQVVMLDKPQHYGIVSHIYTKDGKFFPLVRSISMDGFWSKYYTSGNALNSISDIEQLSISNIGTGPQQNSIVHLDNQTTPKIPYLFPTTLPPVAIIKTDRKTVYSGIYNGAIEGALARRGLPTTVYAWFSGETTTPSINKDVPIEVTYVSLSSGAPRKVTLHTDYDAITATHAVAIFDCWMIVEAKLKYCTEASAAADSTNMLYPGERVYLRICHTSSIQSVTLPKIESMIAPSASITNKTYMEYSSTGISVPHGSKILISGTANFDGSYTATKQFSIGSFNDLGATVRVTTTTPHGIPDGQIVTIADSSGGALDGDHPISNVHSTTEFDIETGATPIAGGAPTVTIKNGFFINKSISSGMPASEPDVGGFGIYDHTNDPVICSVSPGWPQHVHEDRGFFTTIDASESRTRASNLTIPESSDNLWLDRGDFSFNRQIPDTAGYGTDIFSAEENQMESYRERHSYTHDPYVNNAFSGVRGVLDDRASGGDNRFLDDYRLLRLQVKDDRTETDNNKLSYSKIESFNDRVYQSPPSPVTTPKLHYPSEVGEKNIMLTSINRGSLWTDAVTTNDDSVNSIIDLASETITAPGSYPTYWAKNLILIAKSERKFDRLFIGLKNVDATNLEDYDLGKCRITLQYFAPDPLKKLGSGEYGGRGIQLKSIPFTDYTKVPKPASHGADDPDFVSLAVNGPLVFEAPEDWIKMKYNTAGATWPTIYPFPSDWDFNSYMILMNIAWEDTESGGGQKPQIKYIYPYDNTHSEVIKVIDSMHVSLNDILIAQSISWNRAGKYINITDRIGRSEIRKIGSEGGSIRFGGVGHGDYSTSSTAGMASYNKMKKYQQEGTPVYLDVQRSDGTYVRFFGKITSLSEDLPVGKATTRWGVELATEAVAEIANDGTWLSDGLISLGGILDERQEFI